MLEGQRRLLHVAQSDITQEELGFGECVSFDQAMLLDDAIGEFGVAGGENALGNRLPFRPPRGWPNEIVPRPLHSGQVVIIDARSERTYTESDQAIPGAIRLPPDQAVRTAAQLGIPKTAVLAVLCA